MYVPIFRFINLILHHPINLSTYLSAFLIYLSIHSFLVCLYSCILWSICLHLCKHSSYFYLFLCTNSFFLFDFLDFLYISLNRIMYLFIKSSTHLSIHLSIYLSIYLTIYLSVYLSIYLSICFLSIYLSVYLSIYLSIYLSTYLSIYLHIYLSIFPLSIYISICLPIYLSIYLQSACPFSSFSKS